MTILVVWPSTPDETTGALTSDLVRRVVETADLTDRRGYGLPLDDFSRLLYGGPLAPSRVAEAVALAPGLAVIDDVVVRTDRGHATPQMRLRRRLHQAHSREGDGIARDFAMRLVATCPLVRCVALSGSLASGGFDPRDDVDFNLVVRDGSKYTTYLWAIALSAVTSLRNIRKETDEMGALPLLPKVICLNVVWEDAQVRPFVRNDKWIAYELLMARPVYGSAYLSGVFLENQWLESHFPQLLDPGFVPPDDLPEGSVVERPGARFFRYLDRHPRALRAFERASRFLVFSLHAIVSLTRARNPEAKAREDFVNTMKRPYSVFDVPGHDSAIPPTALDPR